jgi:hypothetical protein
MLNLFRLFSTSSVLLSLRAKVPELTSSLIPEGMVLELGQPVPRVLKPYHFPLPSIHASNFFEALEELITKLHSSPEEQFSIILQPILSNGQNRTLGHSFSTNIQPKMDNLKEWLQPLIDTFEAQSGSGDGKFTDSTLAIIRNVTDLPEPQATPISSSPANVEAIKQIKADARKGAKAQKRASSSVQVQTLDAVTQFSSNLNSGFAQLSTQMSTGLDRVVDAIKSQPSVAQTPNLGTFNWSPVVQGLVSGVAAAFGGTVNFPSATPTPSFPSSAPVATPTAFDTQISTLEAKVETLTSTVNRLANSQKLANSQISSLTSNMNTLSATLQAFIAASTPKGSSDSNGSSSSSNEPGSSTPAAPTPSFSSQKNSPPVISTLPEVTPPESYENSFVTADLEALITPEGLNLVYMAAWFNGIDSKVFDISQYGYDPNTMLEQFWIDLILNNRGRNCYFHNFGGYDAILSLASLLNLPGFKFSPLIKDGEIMAIKILDSKGNEVLHIMDSIRILPAALGKLAKDWKVETQKDHFPHYFYLGNAPDTLNYVGSIPEYRFFEPKRTSQVDYGEMVKEFATKPWNFLLVSKSYILGDVKALFQILLQFFTTLVSKFPINPLAVLSAPSAAFKIWRTVQLPKLNEESLKVYDLSRNLDSTFRKAYCGGIVDVYRPHLIGEGYYYDVNSLYPTAMCKPMPVGAPTLVNLNIDEFLNGAFFGFVEATVKSPDISTPGGYIGLLPLKYNGRLICPGGIFTGFFFSEELYFALKNGYTLLSINLAYSFQRGVNTFLGLIQTLNEMKVQAQLNKQPTIRNLAKLLMNSMYGRFGMHITDLKYAFLNEAQIFQIAKNYVIKDQISFGALSLVSFTLNELSKNVGSNSSKRLSQFVKGLPGNTNVAIAAAVTAYSRMIINQYKLDALNLGLELYYSDTDSLVVNNPLPPEYCDSAKLGLLKLEHTFKEGIFVMPKVYYLELADGSVISKCKGFSGQLTKDQYLALKEGKTLELSVTRWFRSLKASSVQIQRGTPYEITFQFNKRERVFENGRWVNTAPITF